MNIKDIAKIAGVSISTVSRVVNDQPGVKPDIREKVKKIVKEYNYIPNVLAVNLLKKKTNVIGIILPSVHSYFYDRAEAISEVCSKNGYSIMIANSRNKIEEEISNFNLLYEKQVDGIIFFVTKITEEHIKILNHFKEKMPIVLVDREIEESGLPCIVQDNFDGAKKAVRYLIECGHKKIVFISGPKENENSESRYRGYVDVLKENGIEDFDKYYISGDFSMKAGYEGIIELLSRDIEMPTAVFAANDSMAIGAIKALSEKGIKIPDEISIVGFDDIEPVKYTIPALTTVHQDQYEVGEQAAELLMGFFDTKKYKVKKIIMGQRLIIRESVRIII